MSNQGSFLGWAPSTPGGGGSDYPFATAYAKTRRWVATFQTTLPQGALIVDILNTGVGNATIEVGGGNQEILRSGMRYNFSSIQNTVDQKQEVSKDIIVNPASGEQIEIFIAYPASSAVNVDSL